MLLIDGLKTLSLFIRPFLVGTQVNAFIGACVYIRISAGQKRVLKGIPIIWFRAFDGFGIEPLCANFHLQFCKLA